MKRRNKIKRKLKKVLPISFLAFARDIILKKPYRQIPKRLFNFVFKPIATRTFLKRLNNLEKNGRLRSNSLNSIFNDASDDFWFWMHSEGYKRKTILQNLFPRMPTEDLQLQYTGLSGYKTLEEAFLFYKFVKLHSRYALEFKYDNCNILDYGCGWGRIIRFFLKELPPSNLYGIDCDEKIIDICLKLNLNCCFSVNNIFPPTAFKDATFDLIYSFSVFSHLSEDSHKKWLIEFSRILKPGGILIVTTRHRDFIINCARLRQMPEDEVPFFASGPARSFLDTEKNLTDYDNGKYVYEPVGGGGLRDGSFYGETCIPKKYVMDEWSKYFNKLDFIDYKEHLSFDQNAIIAQK